MKIILILASAIFITACATKPFVSASEKELSAREDARDQAMAVIMQYKTK